MNDWTSDKYNVIKHNCNNFSDLISNHLVNKGIPVDIINQPSEFLATPLGPMVEPMIKKMQDSLKIKSNQIFDYTSGKLNSLKRAAATQSLFTKKDNTAAASASKGPNLASFL